MTTAVIPTMGSIRWSTPRGNGRPFLIVPFAWRGSRLSSPTGLGGCLHRFCRECLYDFTKGNLDDGNVRGLVCPKTSCQAPFLPADVRACTLEIGDLKSWQIYEEQSTAAFLQADKEAGVDTQQRSFARKPPAEFDCAVCLERVDCFLASRLSGCNHQFCRACLSGYVKSKLADKNVKGLTCPGMTCQQPFSAMDIRACTIEIGDIKSWRQHQEQSTEAFLDSSIVVDETNPANATTTSSQSSSSSLRRCPAKHCNFSFEFEPGDASTGHLFICPSCNKSYFLNCPIMNVKVGPAHNGTCQQVLQELQESQKTTTEARRMEKGKRRGG